jgi:hypothetical protein
MNDNHNISSFYRPIENVLVHNVQQQKKVG